MSANARADREYLVSELLTAATKPGYGSRIQHLLHAAADSIARLTAHAEAMADAAEEVCESGGEHGVLDLCAALADYRKGKK